MAAIDISGLVKTFGHVRALDGLDLTVETGEVHGFLGPNGAGKSTTIRVLGRLRGGIDGARRDDLIERFELDPTKKGRTYSKGNRQKVALVAGLASDAELLLLDEPTSGLDPLKETVFQDVINQMKAEGRTILLSSHILAQVEELADRVSIIRQGEIVQSGTLTEMRHMTRTTIEADTSQPVAGLERIPGIHDLEATDGRVRFAVEGDCLNDAVRALSQFEIRSLTSHPPTLEELMLRHYGDELTAAGNSNGEKPGNGNGEER